MLQLYTPWKHIYRNKAQKLYLEFKKWAKVERVKDYVFQSVIRMAQIAGNSILLVFNHSEVHYTFWFSAVTFNITGSTFYNA